MRLLHGSNLDVLPTIDPDSIDAIVTDPPYELGFMCKKWDASGIAYNVYLWQECLRVLKPGGHLLAFGGTRTYHRMTCAIEDAGFEIRDCIQWIYGSGFPKSHNVSKSIDKKLGLERIVIGSYTVGGTAAKGGTQGRASVSAEGTNSIGKKRKLNITSSASDEAKQWDGWGTALKPANEPIVMARKPLIGTVADNVLAYGTGGLNIDAGRVGSDGGTAGAGFGKKDKSIFGGTLNGSFGKPVAGLGRWPANVIFDEEAGNMLDEQARGEVSRFFYCPKPNKKERNAGAENIHPTIKPISLMSHLIKLVTPIGGIVLDPFMGSGTTGIAAVINDYDFIGIEQSAEYIEIAESRIKHYAEQPKQMGLL